MIVKQLLGKERRCALKEEPSTVQRGDYMNVKKGIDISYHQGTIDFDLIKKNGVEFVIIREGYRNSTDKKFFEYVEKAKKAGLIILGVYHFAYALNEIEAKMEADLCVGNMITAELGPETLVFYDFEYDTVRKAVAKGVILDHEKCNSHTVAFCERIKEYGYTPGVYTNLDYYKHWYTRDTLSKYYIWLADYKGKPDFDCLIQQYSSKGKIPGIQGNVDLNYYYEKDFIMRDDSVRSRSEVVQLATSWLGRNEADGSYKAIVDLYNSYKGPLPRGTKMRYDWAWCACTWSALAIGLDYTDIMPIEISCGELIKQAQNKGCWIENDAYIPKPGDALLYDWDDKGTGDNISWPDHIGVVDYVNESAGYMTIIEGNYENSVKKRTVSLNGRYIRGYITPKYTDDSVIHESLGTTKDLPTIAREVISGLWGNGEKRKAALEQSGYNYKEIQAKVNEILNTPAVKPHLTRVETSCFAKSMDRSIAGFYVTTGDLHCRNDAGSNKKSLCVIPKGTSVRNHGYYTEFNGVKWLLIRFDLDGVTYTGFSSSKYLKKS